LTPDQLDAAALVVIDRDGIAELTMRAVAEQLGVSTMGLYRYVRGRRELEALVVELVLGAVETSPAARAARARARRGDGGVGARRDGCAPGGRAADPHPPAQLP
jgi:AcrR family transcriptional regulator